MDVSVFFKYYLELFLIVHIKAQVDPCTSYTFLNDTSRSIQYHIKVSETPKCDHLKFGWYRFTGSANGIIATACPLDNQCGTTTQIWSNESMPSVLNGESTINSCVRMASNCCKLKGTLGVKNCATFFVYHLIPFSPTDCRRYCFDGNMATSTTNIYSIKTVSPRTNSQKNASDDSNLSQHEEKVTTGTLIAIIVGSCVGGILCFVVLILGVWKIKLIKMRKINQARTV